MQDTDTIREYGKERKEREDSWNRLRGILKKVFAEFGGGEAYLRAERGNFESIKPE
jgi:hypothetical protein